MRPYSNHGWDHANDVRTIRRIQRRAVFLARVESGEPREQAASAVGIKARQARRYLAEARYASA